MSTHTMSPTPTLNILDANDAARWINAPAQAGLWPSQPGNEDLAEAYGWLERAWQGGEALAGPHDALPTTALPQLGEVTRALYLLVRAEHSACPGAALVGCPRLVAPRLHAQICARAAALLLLPGRRGRLYLLRSTTDGPLEACPAALVAAAVAASAHALFSVELVALGVRSATPKAQRWLVDHDTLANWRLRARAAAVRHVALNPPLPSAPHDGEATLGARGRTRTLAAWRRDAHLRALGYLLCRGGACSGAELGAALGLDARGLRPLLGRQPGITVEQRSRTGRSRGEAWYVLDAAACARTGKAA